MKLSNAFGYALLGTCLYGAVTNSFLTDEEKGALEEIGATNEVERAGCAAALGLKTTLGLTQGEIVAAIRGVDGERADDRVEVKNVESGREGLESAAGETRGLRLRRPDGLGSGGTVLGRSQWGIRGAWDDDYYQTFVADWVFPFGTNHLSGVVVYSQGRLAASSYDESFVALPIPVAIVPREGVFTVEQTSNSTVFAWWNVRPGRTATETLDAQIELFRNGDYCVSTNGVIVERYIRGNPHPDVPIGQDDDYRDWVDEQVGVGLTNGLYKFTASFPVDPIEFTLLRVGDESVVVTNAGEYVFLLEKGREYEFETIPYDPTVEYDMCDDIVPLSRMRLMGWWGDDSSSAEWSIGGGENWLNYPGMYWWGYTPGWCCWMPTLQGSPGFTHLGPDDFPITLEAILTDYCGSETPSFQWSGSNDNVTFSNPNGQTTELNCDSLPIWDSLTLSVEANFGGYSMWSHLVTHYGTNNTPQVRLNLVVPEVVILPSNKVDCASLRPLSIMFESDVETNGTIRLSCISGCEKIRVWRSQDKASLFQLPFETSAHEFDGVTLYVEGLEQSSSIGDIQFLVEFVPGVGDSTRVQKSMTVATVSHQTISLVPAERTRLDLGVGEEVVFYVKPEACFKDASTSSGTISEPFFGQSLFTASSEIGEATVSLRILDLEASVEFFVVPPLDYRVNSISYESIGIPGEAGLLSLDFDIRLVPETVSFYRVEVMEVPLVSTNAIGYFTRPDQAEGLDHGKRGAGHWGGVGFDNSSPDHVQIGFYPRPWESGSFSWEIPNVWRVVRDEAGTNEFVRTEQRFELDSDGTARVFKFGFMGVRGTNDVCNVIERP